MLKTQWSEAIQEELMRKTGLHAECLNLQHSQRLFNQIDAFALLLTECRAPDPTHPHA